MLDMTERLVRAAGRAAVGKLVVGYQGRQIDLAKPFSRLGLPDAIRQQGIQGDLRERKFLSKKLTELGVEHGSGQGWGALQLMLFEAVAEKHLPAPPLVVEFPGVGSPRSVEHTAEIPSQSNTVC